MKIQLEVESRNSEDTKHLYEIACELFRDTHPDMIQKRFVLKKEPINEFELKKKLGIT
jgi:hypothetical protein